MPYKHKLSVRHQINKKSVTRNWSEYNKQLIKRGDISIWITEDLVNSWYESERIFDGTGTPQLYSDTAILIAHQIRQVFKLPLRQCEGFINALFKLMKFELTCPCYSSLSKRLSKLNLNQPAYRLAHRNHDKVKSIAIDSSGLQCFEHDEWFTEKYGENKRKKNWRKLHITVDNYHIIQTAILTERKIQDCEVVNNLIEPMNRDVNHLTADAAYDGNPTYKTLNHKFPKADIVIQPQKNALDDKKNAFHRNRNIREIKCYGQMNWQELRDYGKRNQAELAFSRYKRILGGKLHAREFSRQKREAIIGCSILNKMTLGVLAGIRQKI
jgi:transposase